MDIPPPPRDDPEPSDHFPHAADPPLARGRPPDASPPSYEETFTRPPLLGGYAVFYAQHGSMPYAVDGPKGPASDKPSHSKPPPEDKPGHSRPPEGKEASTSVPLGGHIVVYPLRGQPVERLVDDPRMRAEGSEASTGSTAASAPATERTEGSEAPAPFIAKKVTLPPEALRLRYSQDDDRHPDAR